MLRCASWEAVSSKRQALGDKMSLDRQRSTNLEAIQRIGGSHVVSLVVPGESRSIILFEDACQKVRAYRQLKELVDTRAIDVLVCYTHSRLGREISLCESVIAYCLAGGVAIYDCCAPPTSLNPNEQKRNAGDRLRNVIRSWESMTEVQRLTRNTADGVAKGVRLGNLPPGRKPKFYMVRYKENGEKYLIVNEGEAQLARRVYNLYLDGHGENAIGEKLGRTQSYVRYVLGEVLKLSGRTEVNKRSKTGRDYIVAPGNHPAIITEDVADRVIEEFKRRKSTRRPSKRNQYIYSGIVICSSCNVSMSVDRIRDGSNYYHYVVCHRCRRRVSFAKVGKAIEEWKTTLYNPLLESEVNDSGNELTQLRDELTQLATKRSRLIDLYTDGLVSKDEYTSRVAELASREQAVSTRVDTLQQSAEDKSKRMLMRAAMLDTLRNYFDPLDDTGRNLVYRSLLRVYCDANKELTVKFT